MTRRRTVPTVLAISISLVIVSTSAAAQDSRPPDDPTQAVHFTISTHGGGTTFQIGELIPLDLSFSSVAGNTYQVEMWSLDRGSGLGGYEEFEVLAANGWSDPLRDYLSSLGGFAGSGGSTSRNISEKPVILPLELNEWVRFDSPGRYRLRVTSHRVSKVDRQNLSILGNQRVTLASNELELTIVPATREWQDETLRRALEVIDRSPPAPAFQSEEAASLRLALKTVRHVGTAAAAQEMARRFDDDNDLDYSFGLIGSPERDAALKAMQQSLTDPDQAITPRFLTTLSILSIPSGQAPDVMRKTRAEASDRIRSQLWETISSKTRAAKSISLYTALSFGGNGPIPDGAIHELVEVFDDLPAERQVELLNSRWDLLKGPDLLPSLRKYARQYQDFPMLNESKAFTSIRLSGLALQRWYELAPDEARSAVIEELVRPKPRFSATTLGILPDTSLPNIEQTLVEHLNASDNYQISGNLASLIERYGTPAMLPQMLSIIDKHVGRWACAIQTPALAYVLRVDPASARTRIEAAMAARGPGFSACNHSLLVEVGQLHNDSVLERVADQSLSDGDAEVAANAASYLGQFGTSVDEQRLWDRFEQWSDEWRGREAELKVVMGERNPNQEQRGLGHNLAQSLATGKAWLADPPKLQRIAALTLDASQRQQIERMAAAWQGAWSITCIVRTIAFNTATAAHRWSILQYEYLSMDQLEQKLAQFPQGSQFVWNDAQQPKPPDQDAVYRELSKFISDHGMSLREAN